MIRIMKDKLFTDSVCQESLKGIIEVYDMSSTMDSLGFKFTHDKIYAIIYRVFNQHTKNEGDNAQNGAEIKRIMRKNWIKKITICALAGAMTMSLAACGGDETETKKAEVSKTDTSQKTDKVDKTTESNEKKDAYEKVFSGIVLVNDKKKDILITQNTKDVKDTIIKIEDQKVKLKRVSVDIGYAQCQAEAVDVTGDGKEEIVLYLHGGASGAAQDIQVFAKENDVWEEVATPAALWEDDFIIFTTKKEKTTILVTATDTKQTIEIDQDKNIMRGLRNCVVKNGKIVITDNISCNVVGNVIATVRQNLKYNKSHQKFTFSNTAIIWNMSLKEK